MAQILEANPRKKSTAEKFNQAFGTGMEMLGQYTQKQQRQQAVKDLGLDPRILQLPEQAQVEYFKKAFTPEKGMTPLQESQLKLNEERLKALQSQQKLFEQMDTQEEPKKSKIFKAPFKTEIELEESPKQKNGLSQVSEETLRKIAGFKGQPGEAGIRGNIAQAELDAREKKQKTSEGMQAELRKETLPARTEIAERGDSARRGIENKQTALKLIRTGNIDDPTFATLMENLPFKLGQRMLSPETVEYKAALVDNYGDLKTLFPGAIRVKEIEVLENKIADLYLTDEQKTRILESRINAHKADIIRAEVAAEMEDQGEFFSIGKYRQELEKRAKPRLEALFNQILDEQSSIIKDAENRKHIPLNFDDPDDAQIIEQIFIEAGKNPEEAEKLAKKKGYTW